MRSARAVAWLGAGALVVLGARTIAYALSPSPLARQLGTEAGGPGLPLVAVVSIALAVALAAAVVWLAALGVRERGLLEPRPVLFEPRLRLGRFGLRAAALALTTMPAFALVESYLHWRQGLGWHGLHCLIGPAHRNAIPVLCALSLLTAALAAALEHVLAWMRRTLARIARPRLAPTVMPTAGLVPLTLAPTAPDGTHGARAPPAFA